MGRLAAIAEVPACVVKVPLVSQYTHHVDRADDILL